jgi:hypothetical protein
VADCKRIFSSPPVPITRPRRAGGGPAERPDPCDDGRALGAVAHEHVWNDRQDDHDDANDWKQGTQVNQPFPAFPI